jgi:hypothetical protein
MEKKVKLQLRPRFNNGLEKNCFNDLYGIPNTGSSGRIIKICPNFAQVR